MAGRFEDQTIAKEVVSLQVKGLKAICLFVGAAVNLL